MSAVLQSLSTELADAVESAGRAVVAIHARRRIPASGVLWRPGVVVATNHTINRDENITVDLPDGTTTKTSLAGCALGNDLAVLKVAGLNATTANIRSPTASSASSWSSRSGARGRVSRRAGAW
jgi:S1-C subfamily serine protease